MPYIIEHNAIWKLGRGIISGAKIGSVVRHNINTKKINIKIDSDFDLTGENVRIYLYTDYADKTLLISKVIDKNIISFMLDGDLTYEFGSHKIELVISSDEKRYSDATYMYYDVVQNVETESTNIIPSEETVIDVNDLIFKLEKAIEKAKEDAENVSDEIIADIRVVISNDMKIALAEIGGLKESSIKEIEESLNISLVEIDKKILEEIIRIGNISEQHIAEISEIVSSYKNEISTLVASGKIDIVNTSASEIASITNTSTNEKTSIVNLSASEQSKISAHTTNKISEINTETNKEIARIGSELDKEISENGLTSRYDDLEWRMSRFEVFKLEDTPSFNKLKNVIGVINGVFGYWDRDKTIPFNVDSINNWEDNGIFSDLPKPTGGNK